MRDFALTPTCTSDKPGGDSLATGQTFPYRPSKSPGGHSPLGAAFFTTDLDSSLRWNDGEDKRNGR